LGTFLIDMEYPDASNTALDFEQQHVNLPAGELLLW
jgi:hypothetical protein